MKKRIGVVGVGYMGALHAEKLVALEAAGEAVALCGVADIVADRAARIGARHRVPAFADIVSLASHVDAVVVAVPTVEHFNVVGAAFDRDLDVLVEKPIAATLEEAETLLERAERQGLVLQVGHLEWFNTAMEAISRHVDRPRFIEVHRMGPFPDRATDVDVVRDLMIHDLDILQQLLGSEPERIEAVGVPVLTESVDIANARLTYPCGAVANLTASRVSPKPMRKLRFFQPDGYFSVDFLEQSAVMARRTEGAAGPAVEVERLDVPKGDALLAQLSAFARAMHTRSRPHSRPAPRDPGGVDGHGGLGALRTALRVVEAIETSAAREVAR